MMARTRNVLVDTKRQETDRRDIADLITDIHHEVKERNELKTVLSIQPKDWRNTHATRGRANPRGVGFINTFGIG